MIKSMEPNSTSPNFSQSPAPTGGEFDPSQFDFIMNPNKPPRRGWLPTSSGARNIIFGAIATVVVLALLAMIWAIVSGSDKSIEGLVKVAQQQTEIVRLAEDGNRKAQTEPAKSLAALTNTTITSDKNALTSYLAQNKRKLKPKELAMLADKQADSKLAAAASNGRYEDALIEIILSKIAEYIKTIDGLRGSIGAKGQKILDDSAHNATLILKAYRKP